MSCMTSSMTGGSAETSEVQSLCTEAVKVALEAMRSCSDGQAAAVLSLLGAALPGGLHGLPGLLV